MKDLPGMLKQIKAWGIDEVESAGLPQPHRQPSSPPS